MNIYQLFFLLHLQFFTFIDSFLWWYQIDFNHLLLLIVNFILLVKDVKLIFDNDPGISIFDQILIRLNDFFYLIAFF